MIIRKLGTGDYDQFLSLINSFRPTSFSKQDFERTLLAIAPSTDIWVIDKHGVLIGTGTILYERKFIRNLATVAHVEDVFVREQRNGYGKALINHLVQEAKSRGCYKITLDCVKELELFYGAAGFQYAGIQMATYF